jgi:hypothetical protein
MTLPMPFLAIERVLDLLRMPHLDNSHGSPQLDPTAALNAIRLMEDMPDDYPMPVILPDGVGLRVEWSTIPVEIRITSNPGGVHATFGTRQENGVGAVWKLLMESR